MDDIKVRFTISTSSTTATFENWNDLRDKELADQLMEQITKWKHRLMEKAAHQLIKDTYGNKIAERYSVTYKQQMESPTDNG